MLSNDRETNLDTPKKHKEVIWSGEYETQVVSDSWTNYLKPTEEANSVVVDADKEFRKVLDRLKRIAADPTKTVLHSILVSKIQEVLYAYGRSDEWEREDKHTRTLFDRSVARKTTSATKYAKGA